MLFWKIHFDGTEAEIRKMIDKVVEYDEYFPQEEICTDFDFMDEETPQFSSVEEVEEMAQELAFVAPNAGFSIAGTVEDHDYNMDFEIEYDSKKLRSRKSDWYVPYSICRFNYKNYTQFCDFTGLGDKVSKEQFDEWIEEGCNIAVIDGGGRKIYKQFCRPYC